MNAASLFRGDASSSNAIASVISVNGSAVTLGLISDGAYTDERATVGRFVGIRAGKAYLIGVITDLTAEPFGPSETRDFYARAGIDLMGEIRREPNGGGSFRRGVKDHPAIGDLAELVSSHDLRLVYEGSTRRTIEIGVLQQDASIPATVDVDDLVSRHFAVLGATGVGKSSGVAIILDGILETRPDLRIFLLDGHNEYGRCFGERANIIGARDLKLPFWLFNFEETIDVVYGGRPPVAEEVEILAELIPVAKSSYGQYKSASERLGLKRTDARQTGFTVDTPVPYLLQDLLALIDERMGRLENRSQRMFYHRLMTRIETIRNDPRYAFMFENANVGGDVMADLVSHLFRIEPAGKPMTIMQIGGLPVEVVDAVVCVLCRLAFEFGLWSEGAVPLLFVCEEAHRYASADPSLGFNPTRRALSRIAKEGRKYGVFLGLVTQRPAELDPTIISQCSTLFAMRMANERDQALLRSAVSDTAANLLALVPSLGIREVIGFGEGVPLPARIVFKELDASRRPSNEAVRGGASFAAVHDRAFVRSVVDRWRGATMSGRARQEAEPDAAPSAAPGGARLNQALEQTRQRLLQRPTESGSPGAPLGGSLARSL